MMLVKLKGKYITNPMGFDLEEMDMAIFTHEKASPNAGMVNTAEAPNGSKGQSSVVSRLLARVSKLSDTYAEYEMERGVWRKLAL